MTYSSDIFRCSHLAIRLRYAPTCYTVMCRRSGVFLSNYYGKSPGYNVSIDYVICTGDESSLYECHVSWGGVIPQCDDDVGVSIACDDGTGMCHY